MPAKKGSTRAPKDESNEDRFRRVVTVRVNKALSALDGIAQCFRSTTMTHTDDQANKILGVLGDQLQKVIDEARRPPQTKKQEAGFQL